MYNRYKTPHHVSQAPLLLQLAYYDAALIAEEPQAMASRRQQVFADESGAQWRAIAGPCIMEVSTGSDLAPGCMRTRGCDRPVQ